MLSSPDEPSGRVMVGRWSSDGQASSSDTIDTKNEARIVDRRYLVYLNSTIPIYYSHMAMSSMLIRG